MTLKEQVDADLKDAMRAKDENRVNALRMLKAAFANVDYARTDPKNPEHGKPVAASSDLLEFDVVIDQRPS